MHGDPTNGAILVVEDDPDDELLIRRALTRAGIASELVSARDGAAAIERVRQLAGARDLRLVLLDLDLPGVPGLEVLRTVRADPRLRHLPVVVFSSSGDAAVVARSYALGANGFVEKPVDATRFADAVAHVGRLFVEYNVLPPRSPPPRSEVR